MKTSLTPVLHPVGKGSTHFQWSKHRVVCEGYPLWSLVKHFSTRCLSDQFSFQAEDGSFWNDPDWVINIKTDHKEAMIPKTWKSVQPFPQIKSPMPFWPFTSKYQWKIISVNLYDRTPHRRVHHSMVDIWSRSSVTLDASPQFLPSLNKTQARTGWYSSII